MRLLVALLASLLLGGCAGLPMGGGQASGTAQEQSALLRQAAEVAALPSAQQQIVCAEAQARLQDRHTDETRLTLAAMGVVVPDCLSPGDVSGLLKGLPDSPLAAYLGALAARQTAQRQALAQAQDKVSSLQAKLKALTRIEQQINQVKDRELQDRGQGKTAPR